MVPRPREQDPADPDRTELPVALGRQGAFGRRAQPVGSPPAAATPAGDFAPSGVSLRIEDGLLMAFGPDGDPMPPAAFAAAAQEQPEARLRLGEGDSVPAARVAAVLKAQASGSLAGAAEGAAAEAWIKSMLGLGPQPEIAADDALRGEGRGCELTAFARELMISMPAGGTFLITEAADPAKAGAGLLVGASEWLSVSALIGRIRAGARPQPGGQQTQVALPECGIRATAAAVVLELPAIGSVRLVDAPQNGPRAGIFLANGEPAALADLIATLGGQTDADDAGQASQETAAGLPRAEAHAAGDSMVLSLDWPASIAAEADGTADLGVLAAALDRSPDLLGATIELAMPTAASLSSGRRNEDGNWTIAAEELRGLKLRMPVEASDAFALELTVRSLRGATTRTIDVRRQPDAEVPAPSAPSVAPVAGQAPAASPPTAESGATHDTIPPAAEATPAPDAALAAEADETQAPDTARPAVEMEAIKAPHGTSAAAEAGTEQAPEAPAAPIRLAVRPPAGAGFDARDAALVIIGGVPPGAVLSAGIDNGDGGWMLSTQDLVGLELSLPGGAPTDLTLEVKAFAVTSREGEIASAAESLRLSLSPATAAIPLAIDRAAADGLQALMVRDLPAGARLSAGTYDPAIDAWVLLPRQLDGLSVTPAGAGDFTLTIMGIARGADGRAEIRPVSRLPITAA